MTILEDAGKLVTGDRQADYGDIEQNFTDISNMWSVILDKEITASQVVMCMVALKLCRQKNKYKRDNLVDICGYAFILELLG